MKLKTYPLQHTFLKSHTKMILIAAIIVGAVIVVGISLIVFTVGDMPKFIGTWVGTESGSTTVLYIEGFEKPLIETSI